MLLNRRIPLTYVFSKIKAEIFYTIVIWLIAYFLAHNYALNPEIPVSVPAFIGTAISIILSFKLSQSYDRWWEARKIWGSIVNESRTLVVQLQAFVRPPGIDDIRTIGFRQIAWCYCLGQSLRGLNATDTLDKYLSPSDLEHVTRHNNKPLAILQLKEKGKLKLDDPLVTYLPDFPYPEITIRHLLSHTSGIQDFVGLNCDFASWTKKEFLEGLQKTPLSFKPGSQFQYASSTYILLRFIIEKVTGKTYETNLSERILKVAGMTNSGVIHNNEILADRALGYVNKEGDYENALPIANHEIFIGASSIYSTAADLLKFDQALYTEKLLGQKEKELMFTIVQPPYGYGWFISEDSINGKILSHGGDVFGYTTLIERRLKNRISIIILGNLQGIDREKIVNILDGTLN